VQAASHAGDPHLVYISVVGADRVPMVGRIDRAIFGYFGAKFRAEQIVAESGLPWTTLRATRAAMPDHVPPSSSPSPRRLCPE
jgi:uncharacterized protein YbjT (DUF2867 family)